MVAIKFFSFILVLFSFYLINCAPVSKGLFNNSNVSEENELLLPAGAFLTPINTSEKDNISNNTELLLNLPLDSAIKVGGGGKGGRTGGGSKGKTGGGSNKGGGSKSGGHIRVLRPIRGGGGSKGDQTVEFVLIGIFGGAILIAIIVGIVVGCLEEKKEKDANESEEENNEEKCKEEKKEKDANESEEENNEEKCKEEKNQDENDNTDKEENKNTDEFINMPLSEMSGSSKL